MSNRIITLLFSIVLSCVLGCKTDISNEYRVELGEWTRESNLFTFYLATDSAIFPDKFEPLLTEPSYESDTVFYGMILWGFTGDTTEDIQYHVTCARDSLGTELFYFDRNNDEDLTNDGLPLTWCDNPAIEDSSFLEFRTTMDNGYPLVARILYDGSPVNDGFSQQFGREVHTYPMITFSAKRGEWLLHDTTYDIELFTMNPSGRLLQRSGEWFIIDVNHDNYFEFIPPDIRVLLAEPLFEFAGRQWEVEADSLARYITIAEATPVSVVDTALYLPSELLFELEKTNPIVEKTNTAVRIRSVHATTLKGDSISIPDSLGKIVVLNFWHTGCIPCRKEFPELNQLALQFKEKKVLFVGLTFNTRSMVERFLEYYPFGYEIVPEANEIITGFGISAYPVNMVIDRNGFLVYKKLGRSNHIAENLATVIDSLLLEP